MDEESLASIFEAYDATRESECLAQLELVLNRVPADYRVPSRIVDLAHHRAQWPEGLALLLLHGAQRPEDANDLEDAPEEAVYMQRLLSTKNINLPLLDGLAHPELQRRDGARVTPLMYACRHRYLYGMTWLVEHRGADVGLTFMGLNAFGHSFERVALDMTDHGWSRPDLLNASMRILLAFWLRRHVQNPELIGSFSPGVLQRLITLQRNPSAAWPGADVYRHHFPLVDAILRNDAQALDQLLRALDADPIIPMCPMDGQLHEGDTLLCLAFKARRTQCISVILLRLYRHAYHPSMQVSKYAPFTAQQCFRLYYKTDTAQERLTYAYVERLLGITPDTGSLGTSQYGHTVNAIEHACIHGWYYDVRWLHEGCGAEFRNVTPTGLDAIGYAMEAVESQHHALLDPYVSDPPALERRQRLLRLLVWEYHLDPIPFRYRFPLAFEDSQQQSLKAAS